MNYENIAEESHFYNFVFYETEAKTMYIYCPNCGCVDEVKITKEHNVAWIKEHHKPCGCFDDVTKQPEYKNDIYAHERLKTTSSLAEFERRQDGSVALCVYWHYAMFGLSNYEFYERAFKRAPVFSNDKVIEIIFNPDNTVKMDTRLFVPMCSTSLSIGQWRTAKRWRPSSFMFDVIAESFEMLKGTFLEQYIIEFENYIDAAENALNIRTSYNEIFVAWLVLMHTNQGAKKLWKAKYRAIVINKVMELVLPSGSDSWHQYNYYSYYRRASYPTINFRGKTIEKILRISPSKLDKVENREDCDIPTVQAVQRLAKLERANVAICSDNMKIVSISVYDSLIKLYSESKQPISKLFKYIRHSANKNGSGGVITISDTARDYFDYLKNLKTLKTPFTSDVLFPTNLRRAHDFAVTRIKIITDTQKCRAFRNTTKPYEAFTFSNNDYIVEVVKTAIGLKKEAIKMHNCSAGYVDSVIDGKSVIFTIKNKNAPRTAFCMLELNPKDLYIVQNRAVNNAKPPQEVIDFANNWLKQIVVPRLAKSSKQRVS